MPASTAPTAIAIAPTTRSCGERNNAGRQHGIRGALLDGPEQRHADARSARSTARRAPTAGSPASALVSIWPMPTTAAASTTASSAAPSASNRRASRGRLAGSKRAADAPSAASDDGHVDEEQPAPARAQQQPAEQRAEQERDAEHGADEPERAAAPLERHRLGDDGGRDGQQAAGAERLDRAPEQQQRRTTTPPRRAASRRRTARGSRGTRAAGRCGPSASRAAACRSDRTARRR